MYINAKLTTIATKRVNPLANALRGGGGTGVGNGLIPSDIY